MKTEEEVQNWNTFSIKQVYGKFRGEFQKIEWRRLVCNNAASPKWTFILYLALNQRLQTKDRLAMWGIVDNTRCIMCDLGTDSIEHMFFQCAYSVEIWEKVLAWMHAHTQTGWLLPGGSDLGLTIF